MAYGMDPLGVSAFGAEEAVLLTGTGMYRQTTHREGLCGNIACDGGWSDQ